MRMTEMTKVFARMMKVLFLGSILAMLSFYYFSSPFKVHKTEGYELVREGVSTYHIYLSRQVGHIELYTDLIRGMDRLEKQDTIVFHMANNGGYVYSGIQLMHAIKNTKAHTVVKVEGLTYSMGALLTCSAKEIHFNPYSYLMYHAVQGLPPGESYMRTALERMSVKIMANECVSKGILTYDDVYRIVYMDKEVYVFPEDINKKAVK